MTKNEQKADHSIAICLLIGMVYFRCYLVNPHAQGVQNMCEKGGRVCFSVLRAAEVDLR